MNNISKKIVFFGNERLATGVTTQAPTLRALLEGGYDVAAVVISQESTRQSRKARPLEIADVANAHDIPILTPAKVSAIKDNLAALGASVGVLVAFGKFVPPSIIDLFPHGIINIHPSLLPKHRGPTPLESVILNGDHETGVSLMQLTATMDSGPVIAQETILLRGDETKQALADQLLELGKDMLIQYLPAIIDKSLQTIPQDNKAATYSKLLDKKDAWLRPDLLTAVAAERRVRAHLGFPKTKLNLLGHDIIITKTHTSVESKTPLDLLCRDGVYLSIDELIAPSGRRISAQAFLNGYAAG